MKSQSRAGAIFCLRKKSLKNELRAAPCCGFTSSSAKETFCQTFSRTASAPPEELLLQRSCSSRGARAGAIFRGARALPNRSLISHLAMSHRKNIYYQINNGITITRIMSTTTCVKKLLQVRSKNYGTKRFTLSFNYNQQ